MSDVRIEEFALLLDDAAKSATAIEQLSARLATPLSLADAYRVQAASVQRRLSRGERRAGMKMGFTSRAKMAQMKVETMIWGRLTDAMSIEEGGRATQRFIHPRVEPEVAFVLRRRLSGKVTLAEAALAVEAVAPALEVIDSRYRDFKFSLPDVVADNASSSGFVLGPLSPAGTDVSNLGLILELNGERRQLGSTAAILGAPLRSLVAAAALAAESGEALEPGTIVMAGGATAAEALKPGTHVQLTMQSLGRVSFSLA